MLSVPTQEQQVRFFSELSTDDFAGLNDVAVRVGLAGNRYNDAGKVIANT